MKKLAFIALFGLGSLTAFAQVADPAQQTTDPTQPQTTNPTEQTVDPTQQQTTDPTERRTADPAQRTAEKETPARDADGYSEIKKRELPDMVKKSIKQNYPKSKIKMASSNEEGQYKLEVDLQDGNSETIFVDKEGNPMEQ